MEDTVVFLCTKNELNRERQGYFKAFSSQINTICISYEKLYLSDRIDELIPSKINPILAIHADSWPRLLPQGLTTTTYPTACFQIDTFEYPQARAEFSQLFDYVFVFHPGYDHKFAQFGHPNSYVLPHAVDADMFTTQQLKRIYDVGWVGRLDGNKYSLRRKCIKQLHHRYQMNNIERYYSPSEMATVYQQSKIVVNLSRDDYLQDANLRCFEAMAGGALLITPKPTELSAIGFVEGVHYVAFEDQSELLSKVEYYLKHEQEREAIAQSSQKLVLGKHTYNVRAKTILDIIKSHSNQLFAPAREWDSVTVCQQYFKYFCRCFMLNEAFTELKKIHQFQPLKAHASSLLLLKALAIKFRDSLN